MAIYFCCGLVHCHGGHQEEQGKRQRVDPPALVQFLDFVACFGTENNLLSILRRHRDIGTAFLEFTFGIQSDGVVFEEMGGGMEYKGKKCEVPPFLDEQFFEESIKMGGKVRNIMCERKFYHKFHFCVQVEIIQIIMGGMNEAPVTMRQV